LKPPVPLTLSRDLARAIRGGHPWVFRDAVEGAPRLDSGTAVELRAGDGRPLALGFWDARSAIAVRILQAGPLADLDREVDRRLQAAMQFRLGLLDRNRTNAFRWIHGEADRLPGIHVDLYGAAAVVRFDGDGAPAFYGNLGARLAAAARPLDLEVVLDRRSGERLWGRGAPARFEVLENALRFEVSPGAGGKGGLFLDQRENREEVERRASGKSVLNLFGATGGFSLYAARGGARSTDTVDSARPAIAAARRNFDRNGLSTAKAGFHAADAFEFLEEAQAARRSWDLVISDPPSFAPNQASRENARKAYARLHRLAASVTARGGTLCAASCSSHVGREEFLSTIRAGAEKARRSFDLEAVRGAGVDHPVLPAFPEGDYLKMAFGRVR
jgi:23S rRNA (cytosine1962-C5)-methyltransferase